MNAKPSRKTKKIKSPSGYLSEIEVVRLINAKTDLLVSINGFKNWIEKGLFPKPDTQDNINDIYYWSDFIVTRWTKNIPKECKSNVVVSLQSISC